MTQSTVEASPRLPLPKRVRTQVPIPTTVTDTSLTLETTRKPGTLTSPNELEKQFGLERALRIINSTLTDRRTQLLQEQQGDTPTDSSPLDSDRDPTWHGGEIETLTYEQRFDLIEVRSMLQTRTQLSQQAREDEIRWLIKNPDLIEYSKYFVSHTYPISHDSRQRISPPLTKPHKTPEEIAADWDNALITNPELVRRGAEKGNPHAQAALTRQQAVPPEDLEPETTVATSAKTLVGVS